MFNWFRKTFGGKAKKNEFREVRFHYGMSVTSPVMTGMGPSGANRYFRHLRCPAGQSVVYTRRGSTITSDLSYISREKGRTDPSYGNMLLNPQNVPVDIYNIKCNCGKHEIEVYVDMYHLALDRCIDAKGWTFHDAFPDRRTLQADEMTEPL
jgi:hypothetical protein